MTERTISIRTLKALDKATAKDMTFPVLTRIGIRDGRAAAADGFVLVTTPVEGFPQPTLLDGKAIIGAARGVKRASHAQINTDQTATVFGDIPGQEVVVSKSTVSDETFPDWKAIMPDYAKEPVVELALNAELLKKLCDAVLQSGSSEGQMVFTIPVERQNVAIPIRFTGQGGQPYEAIIMPMVRNR